MPVRTKPSKPSAAAASRTNTPARAHTGQLTLFSALIASLRPPKNVRKPPLSERKPPPTRPQPPPCAPKPDHITTAVRTRPDSMRTAYDKLAAELPARYGITVTKWRTTMSGVATLRRTPTGAERREIEAPYPKGPMSAAVFCHEIAHHALGVGRVNPRCLEEYAAWAWAIHEMQERGLNVTPAVRRRMHASLHYAVHKALRRGLERIPAELRPYLDPPPPKPR